MKIAFYAPMKSPDSAQPSGDRTIGRLLIKALMQAGADVRVVSHLRTWSPAPDPSRLSQLAAKSQDECATLITNWHRETTDWCPDLWLTYHSYYKAPDLLGPLAAEAVAIPYVIVEASFSERRANDGWSSWLAAARHSIERADAIFNFTERDRRGLIAVVDDAKLHHLPPFIDIDANNTPSTRRHHCGPDEPVRLATVAMMRHGAKLASYRVLAESLALIGRQDWRLDIAGDGEARADVEQAFAGIAAGRLTMHGALDQPAMQALLNQADVFVWPGVDEAFGMVYLEAQARGLPVVALRTAGVPEVVTHNRTGLLAEPPTAARLAACLEQILTDQTLRATLGGAARASVTEQHSLKTAADLLQCVLRRLLLRP